MAITRARLRQLQADDLHQVSFNNGEKPRSPGRWLTEPGALPAWVPPALAVAWLTTLPLVYALEPAPARDGPTPVWGIALEVALIAALTATVMGLAGRRRLGLVASAGAVGVVLLGAVMCPVSGHHVTVGAWWYAQLAALTALGGASLAGLRWARPRGAN